MTNYLDELKKLKSETRKKFEIFHECKDEGCKAKLDENFQGFVLSDKSRKFDVNRTIAELQSLIGKKFCDCVIFDANESKFFVIFAEIKNIKKKTRDGKTIQGYRKEAIGQFEDASEFIEDEGLLPHKLKGSSDLVVRCFLVLPQLMSNSVKSMASNRKSAKLPKILGRERSLKIAKCGQQLVYP